MLMKFWKANINYRDCRCSELDFYYYKCDELDYYYDRWNAVWMVYKYVWDGDRFHYTGTCKDTFGRARLFR